MSDDDAPSQPRVIDDRSLDPADPRSQLIAARYGIPDRKTASRRVAIISVITTIIACLFLWYFFLHDRPSQPTVNTVSISEGNREVTITFTIHGQAGKEVECRAEAVNAVHAQVGLETIRLTLEADSSTHTIVLPTVSDASDATITNCAYRDSLDK